MMLISSLFEGEKVRLSPLSPELDAPIIASWTYDLEFSRFFRENPPRPLAIFEIRKQIEDWQKKSEEKRCSYYFAIRRKDGDTPLIGIVRIPYVEWNNQYATLYINIANKNDESQYFKETAKLVLNFLFNELNIHSAAVLSIASDQEETINAYLKEGFSIDVRLKEAQFGKGKYLDELCLGILRPEWLKQERK
jgi:RimJ/RimL family protein N-acetyltransferase